VAIVGTRRTYLIFAGEPLPTGDIPNGTPLVELDILTVPPTVRQWVWRFDDDDLLAGRWYLQSELAAGAQAIGGAQAPALLAMLAVLASELRRVRHGIEQLVGAPVPDPEGE